MSNEKKTAKAEPVAIYQIWDNGPAMWSDVSQDQYNRCNRAERRIVYAAPAPQQAPLTDAPAAAWMTEDGQRVVPAHTMEGARRDGGAMLSSLKPYTVALVRAGAASAVTATTEQDAAAIPEGCAIDGRGTTYHNVAEIYYQAEALEALHMWLDDNGAPRVDADGKVFSPVGRVAGFVQDAEQFRWLIEDHDDAEVRERARELAARLGTSSYFAITRDIRAAMASTGKGKQ